MNILFTTVGRRGYIIDFFREHLPTHSKLVGTSDRNDCDSEFTSGFFHCDKNYLVPTLKDEKNYISELLKICEKEKIDILLSFYDYDAYVISKYLDRIEAVGVTPVISSLDVNSICFDKIETYKFLKMNGFNTPWTMTAEEALQSDISSYPVIVKPRFGFGSNAISIARNKTDVEFFLNYYANEEMIVQEFIDGPEFSFDVLNDFDSNVLTVCVKRKIKMRSGETDQGYAIKNEKFADVGKELGAKLGHVGPLDVDFFVKNSQPYILELNPRFGGGYPITYYAGLDFPKILIELYQGKLETSDYEKYHDYEEGNVMIKSISFIEENVKCPKTVYLLKKN